MMWIFSDLPALPLFLLFIAVYFIGYHIGGKHGFSKGHRIGFTSGREDFRKKLLGAIDSSRGKILANALRAVADKN